MLNVSNMIFLQHAKLAYFLVASIAPRFHRFTILFPVRLCSPFNSAELIHSFLSPWISLPNLSGFRWFDNLYAISVLLWALGYV